MNGRRFFLGLNLALLASAAVAAPSAKAPACSLKIENAWVRAAPPGAMQLAGYATLKNDCQEAITVTSVGSVDFNMAMMHQTLIENGVNKMRHLDSLDVPANGSVSFSPGELHLMLMMPARELKEGDEVKLSFSLSSGAEISAEFPVLRDAPTAGK